jgi:hypothetical protein
MDMDIPESGLHVVAVGPFLILEMDKEKLDRAALAAGNPCHDPEREPG